MAEQYRLPYRMKSYIEFGLATLNGQNQTLSLKPIRIFTITPGFVKKLIISGISIFPVRHYGKIAKFKLQDNFLPMEYMQQQQIAWKSFLTSSIAA